MNRAFSKYVLMTPTVASTRGKYVIRIVVVETDQLGFPKMVSPRAKHFVRIVKDFGTVEPGSRAGYKRLRSAQLREEAVMLIDSLNGSEQLMAKNTEAPHVDYD